MTTLTFKVTDQEARLIPELGFVRVSVQRTGSRVTVAEATETLASMVSALAGAHGARLATLDTGIPGAFLVPAKVAKDA